MSLESPLFTFLGFGERKVKLLDTNYYEHIVKLGTNNKNMLAQPHELLTQTQYDVNGVISDALGLHPPEACVEVAWAQNRRHYRPYTGERLMGRGALVIGCRVISAEGSMRTAELVIDESNRLLPEELITTFGHIAIQEEKKGNFIHRIDCD